MKEYNEFIAEFACQQRPIISSIKTGKEYLFDGWWHEIHELKFHESWDWIMFVIDKIEKLDYEITIDSQMQSVNDDREMIWNHDIVISDGMEEFAKGYSSTSKFKAAHEAVVNFIKWHNSKP